MPNGREERKEGKKRGECRRREGKTGKDGKVGRNTGSSKGWETVG